MPQTSIAANVHEPLDVQRNLGSQPPFYLILIINNLPDFACVVRGKIIDPDIRIYSSLLTDCNSAGSADAKDVGQ